jgi:hypothetical protein
MYTSCLCLFEDIDILSYINIQRFNLGLTLPFVISITNYFHYFVEKFVFERLQICFTNTCF